MAKGAFVIGPVEKCLNDVLNKEHCCSSIEGNMSQSVPNLTSLDYLSSIEANSSIIINKSNISQASIETDSTFTINNKKFECNLTSIEASLSSNSNNNDIYYNTSSESSDNTPIGDYMFDSYQSYKKRENNEVNHITTNFTISDIKNIADKAVNNMQYNANLEFTNIYINHTHNINILEAMECFIFKNEHNINFDTLLYIRNDIFIIKHALTKKFLNFHNSIKIYNEYTQYISTFTEKLNNILNTFSTSSDSATHDRASNCTFHAQGYDTVIDACITDDLLEKQQFSQTLRNKKYFNFQCSGNTLPIEIFPYIEEIYHNLNDIRKVALDQKVKYDNCPDHRYMFRRDYSRRYKLKEILQPYVEITTKQNLSSLQHRLEDIETQIHNIRTSLNIDNFVAQSGPVPLLGKVLFGKRADKIYNFVDDLNTTKVEKVVDFILTIKDKSDNFVQTLADLGRQYSSIPLMTRILAYLNRVYILLRGILRKAHFCDITSYVFNLLEGTIPPNLYTTLVTRLYKNLNRAHQGEHQEHISDNTLVTQIGGDSINKTLLGDLLQVFSYGFRSVFSEQSESSFRNYEISTKHLASFCTNLRSCSSIKNFVLDFVKFLSTHISDSLMKMHGILPEMFNNYIFHEDSISTTFLEIEEKQYPERSKTCEVAARTIIDLRNEILELISRRKKENVEITHKMRMSLDYFLRKLDSWISEIPPYLLTNHANARQKPIFISLYGAPGIGKTATLSQLIGYRLLKDLQLIDHYENWDTLCFARNLGDEFWEGYHGQPLITVTDAMQEIANETKLDNTITELGRMNDTNAYPLNMAFGNKGKIYFNSKIIIMDSQKSIKDAEFLTKRTWSGGSHLFRRVDFSVHVKLNTLYKALDDKPGINYQILKTELERSTTNLCIPNNMYVYEIMDLINNNVKKIIYSTTEFLDYISEHSRGLYNFGGQTMSKLEEYNRSLFEAQMFSRVWSYFGQKPEIENVSVEEQCHCNKEFIEMLYAKHFIEQPITHMCFSTEDHFMDWYFPKRTFGAKTKAVLNDFIKSISQAKMDLASIVAKIQEHPIYTIVSVLATIAAGITLGIALTNKSNTDEQEQVVETQPVFENFEDTSKMPIFNTEESDSKILPPVAWNTIINAQSAKKQQRFTKKKIKVRTQINIKGGALRYDEPSVNVQDFKTQAYIQNDIDIASTLNNSMASMYILRAGYLRGNVNIVNIAGDIFMAPNHAITCMKYNFSQSPDSHISIAWARNTYKPINIEQARIIFCDIEAGKHLADVGFFRILHMQPGRNITHLFSSSDHDPSLLDSYLLGIRSYQHKCNEHCNIIRSAPNISYEMLKIGDCTEHWEEQTIGYTFTDYETQQNTSLSLNSYYHYTNSYTVAGDCGMLLLHADTTVKQKVIGMHIAGSETHRGLSAIIFQEDLEDIIGLFSPIHKMSPTQYVTHALPTKGLGCQCLDLDLPFEGSTTTLVNLNGKTISASGSLPGNTKFTKSVIFDNMEEDFGPNISAPAHLTRFTNAVGEIISPIRLALAKNAEVTQLITCSAYNIIKQHILNTMDKYNTFWSHKDKFILTIEQSLNGIQGLNPLEMNTSSGFPFSRLASTTSKIPWVTYTQRSDLFKTYFPTEDLVKAVNERIYSASLGIIPPTFFVDCLKDETRKLDKVEAGKTRLFQVGPLDLSVAIRMYYGLFMVHCSTSFLESEISIGINATSIDWDILARRLLLKGNKFICGDYSNYDAAITYQIGTIVSAAANNFYNDEHSLIRETLLASLFNTDHLLNNAWYLARQGHPSGDALTTIINCIANMFLFRYTYTVTVDPLLTDYDRFVDGAFYGDDNILSVHDTIIDKFNMIAHTQIMQELGIKYTNTSKTIAVVKYVTLEDAEYMSRKFKYWPEQNIFMSIRNLHNILETPRWTSRSPLLMEDLLDRINDVLKELLPHGVITFERILSRFIHYAHLINTGHILNLDGTSCFLHLDANKFFSYNRVLNIWYPDRFPISVKISSIPIFSAQMLAGEGNSNPETQQITTFLENDTLEDQTNLLSEFRTFNTMPTVDLDKFLLRPIEVKTFTWNATHTLGELLFRLDYPADFLNCSPSIKAKLSNIAYWKPDFVISIRLNTTLMHYGRLVFCWIPQAKSLSPHYLEFYNSFSNHWNQVDANNSEPVDINIPFTHYKNILKTTSSVDLFSLFCYVAAPLQSINSTTPEISCAIFSYISKPGCAGYIFSAQIGESQRAKYKLDDVNEEGKEKSKGGITASGIFRKTSEIASYFTRIPLIGGLATQISYVTDSIASVLSYFGLSIPVNENITNPFQIRPPRILQADDTPSSIVLAPQTNCSLVKDFAYVNDTIESISIIRYLQRPALLYTGKIQVSDLRGSVINSTWVSPTMFSYHDYVSGVSNTLHHCTPIMFLSRLFRFWRGSIRFHLSFICSAFHSCRVRVFYVPNVIVNKNRIEPIDYQKQVDCINTVIDIVQTKCFSFTIPFMQESEWLEIYDYRGDMIPWTHANGYFSISIVNTLTCGSSVVNPINYQLFVSAGSDFQLAMPDASTSFDIGGFEAQSGDPCLHMTSLMTHNHPAIGGIDTAITHINSHQYYVPTSLKQLANMVCPYTTIEGAGDKGACRITPTSPIHSHSVGMSTNYMISIMSMFRYFRGGIRVVVLPLEANVTLTTFTRVAKNSTTFLKVIPTIYPNKLINRAFAKLTSGFASFACMQTMPADFIIPWYNKFKCFITAVGVQQTQESAHGVSIDIIHNAGNPVILCLGAADDFIFGFQLGVPTLVKNFTYSDYKVRYDTFADINKIGWWWASGSYPNGAFVDTDNSFYNTITKCVHETGGPAIPEYKLQNFKFNTGIEGRGWNPISITSKLIIKQVFGLVIVVAIIKSMKKTSMTMIAGEATGILFPYFSARVGDDIKGNFENRISIFAYYSSADKKNFIYYRNSKQELDMESDKGKIGEFHVGDQNSQFVGPVRIFELIANVQWTEKDEVIRYVKSLAVYYSSLKIFTID